MGDEQVKTSSPRRLRNHSYKESLTVNAQINKMSGKLPEVEEDPEIQLILKDDFSKKNTVQKLDAVADAINKMYEKMTQVTKSLEEKIHPMENVVFDETHGMVNKIEAMAQGITESNKFMQSMVEENLQLRDELDLLKGVVQKLSNQLGNTNNKVNQLVAKSMEDNLVFTGILGDGPKTNPRKQLHTFLFNEMSLQDVRDVDILSVYRMGQYHKDKNRPIVAHCTSDLRRYIMNNAPILKHRSNEQGAKFYVNPQLPEAISEQRREMRQIINEQKKKEEDLPQGSKSTFVVRNDKLFINGQLRRKKITPPQIQQLFPDEKEQGEIAKIKMRFFHTQPEKGSDFRVAVLKTDSYDILHKAYIKMFQKYPSADHIAVASIIKGEEAYHDNGEFGSGYRILRCLKQAKVQDTVVFLVRYFGGTHLGPRRFTIIMDLVNSALEKVKQQNGTDLKHSPSSKTPPCSRNNSDQNLSSEEEKLQEESESENEEEEKRSQAQEKKTN